MNRSTTDTAAPHGFVPPDMWPEFGILALPVAICRREEVGAGTRWSLWPLCFELYTGDNEPDLSRSHEGALAYNRIILWKRVTRADVPKGWHQSWRPAPWRTDALFVLDGADYRTQWSKDAQRNIKKWEQKYQGRTHEIVSLTFDEYKAAHAQSLTRKKTGSDLLHALERQYAMPQVRPHMEFVGVRNVATGEIIAGNAILTSPTYGSTMRMCPFMLREAREVEAMTGLVDHWFKESQRRGIKNLVFTYFWQKGEPKEWKGFSTFKSHFVQRYITYPPLLWRFKTGKLW